MKQLICDSGGTKASWMLIDGEYELAQFTTDGINPAVNSKEYISNVLNEVAARLVNHIGTVEYVWFYGAGCARGSVLEMTGAIESVVTNATVSVESDMLGAARALCQWNEGIACILGTGANSCYYDGERIRQNTPSLGYILGDEGGGAMLGRTLINNIYKGQWPEELHRQFEEEMQTNLDKIIENVYRRERANKYLAHFTYFLSSNRNNEHIHTMLVNNFEQFFNKNIDVYGRKDLTVGFIGSIASVFNEELREAAKKSGYRVGEILKSPIERLGHFHRSANPHKC